MVDGLGGVTEKDVCNGVLGGGGIRNLSYDNLKGGWVKAETVCSGRGS